MRILFDLRPALAGHAGIPQETRLLYRALASLEGVHVEGLLPGDPFAPAFGRWRSSARVAAEAAVSIASGWLRWPLKLEPWDPKDQESMLWQRLFAPTLQAAEVEQLRRMPYRKPRSSWMAAQAGAVVTGRLGAAAYPWLDTRGFDLLLAQTPFPGRVDPSTRLVVRYHDAVPLRMAETTRRPAVDRELHRRALKRNVVDGAWFACVSQATRRDLLALYPHLESRTTVLPNCLAPHFWPEAVEPDSIGSILRSRSQPGLELARAVGAAPGASRRYLLMVSTLEPRKNHAVLLDAWERLRATGHPELELVLVGGVGWQSDDVVRRLRPWIRDGAAHWLGGVPPDELRQLYSQAAVTVCPSLGEGFGYSGVEAMACGSVVVASEIEAHREVYGDAAEFFDPKSPEALTAVLARGLDPGSAAVRQRQVQAGLAVAGCYRQAAILPRWRELLDRVQAGEIDRVR